MLKKLLSVVFILAITSSYVFAQSGSIRGQITDAETGEPIPTANILLVGLERGTASDVDGFYTIRDIPAGEYTVRVTFVGYQAHRQRITIEPGVELVQNFELRAGQIGLDEVVVTGYGTVTKRELTGSISSVQSRDFQDVSQQNVESILQGRAAGVQVTAQSGAPGADFQVRIRGTGSINASNDPLYIVDGVQISFQNESNLSDDTPLNSINPADIESIEILKDAAASAIYGAQGANGVVLITTKRGQQGDTRVTATSDFGFRKDIKQWRLLDSPQLMEFWTDVFGEDLARGIAGPIIFNVPNADTKPFSEFETFDKQDFVNRTGFSQRYGLSVSGGNESTRFFVSGNFEDTEGHILDNEFQRVSFRTNLDHTFNSKFQGSFTLGITNSVSTGVCEDGNFTNCPISTQAFNSPLTPLKFDDGSFNTLSSAFGVGSNPAVLEEDVSRTSDITSIVGNISPTYTATNWLSFTGTYGIDWRNTREVRIDGVTAAPATNGRVNERNRQVFNFTANAFADIRKSYNNEHNFNGLFGAEYRRDFARDFRAIGDGLPNSLFRVLDATATPFLTDGETTEFRIASYISRVTYNYKEKYFFSYSGRYDGSSRFGSESIWGFFPALSGSWALTEEDFIDLKGVDDLRLRMSYGKSGNSAIGNFAARGLFSVIGSYNGITGLAPDQLANVNLGWEEMKELNIGLDFAFVNSRLTGTIDAYRRTNDDLLLASPLPTDTGFSSINENVGKVRNKGIEVELSSINLDRGGFLWSTRFNVAIQSSQVKELLEGQDQINTGTSNTLRVGRPLQVFKVPVWAGVNPADGRPMWFDTDGNITFNPNEEDEVFFDGGEQDVIGGFGNRVSYRGLSLDVFFQYSFGQTAWPTFEGFFLATPSFQTNVWDEVNRRWLEPGQITDIPRMVNGDVVRGASNQRTTVSTNQLFDASYIRLKNVTLSYQLPSSLTEQIGMRGVRFFATGLNLITWSSWPGLDPEVAGQTITASFPQALQFNGGIELQF